MPLSPGIEPRESAPLGEWSRGRISALTCSLILTALCGADAALLNAAATPDIWYLRSLWGPLIGALLANNRLTLLGFGF